jgi:hypothetical protein
MNLGYPVPRDMLWRFLTLLLCYFSRLHAHIQQMDHTPNARSSNAIFIAVQSLKKAYIEAFPEIYLIAAQSVDGASYMDSLGRLIGVVNYLVIAFQEILHRGCEK